MTTIQRINKDRMLRKSKKGFTLVELVVVIAIIGVLAAIAIPSVVGIISSAGKTKERDNAAHLDEACVNYYQLVATGLVNSDEPGHSTQADLPPKNAGFIDQKAAARSATVVNACEYADLTEIKDQLLNGTYPYVYDNTGNILTKEEAEEKNIEYKELTSGTTMNDLFNQ